MSNGNRILEGLEEALQHAKGSSETARVSVIQVPKMVDVLAIRHNLGMSQEAFALRFGFKISTLRQWEQGRRQPEGPARVLLKIIEKEPEAADRALVAG